MGAEHEFWNTVREVAKGVVAEAAPRFCSFAITTGDAASTETVGTMTTSQVSVWLDGAPQDVANKVNVVLTYGVSAPAAGQLWIVLYPNYHSPGVLYLRLA